MEAHTKAALLARANAVIVVADSTKLAKSTSARICGLDLVGELITDSGADPDRIGDLRKHGLRVTTAPPLLNELPNHP